MVRKGFARSQAGYSLIELTVIIAIVGILAFVAVANFDSPHKIIQREAMIRKLADDIRYARDMALAHSRGTRVYLDARSNCYYLKWEDDEYLSNPVGGGNFIVNLGRNQFPNVKIASSAFGGGRIDFSAEGLPQNNGEDFDVAMNAVTLNGGEKITIWPNTGHIAIEGL